MASVLFVCTGNICRSPMAEAVFKHMVKKNGLQEHFGQIESCGTTSFHSGDEADDRGVVNSFSDLAKTDALPPTQNTSRVSEKGHSL